ncbi:MAG: hypothetical protein ING52_10605 [Burkholderiales bacterium]|jgi:hypothetical protein|nr:hypothetical protein [Burkholderiales bacterium]
MTEENRAMTIWNRATLPPRSDGFYDVKCSDERERRCLYVEGQWRLRGTQVLAWREIPPPRRTVAELDLFEGTAHQLVVDEDDFVSIEATLASPLAQHRELQAVAAVAKLELNKDRGIQINVIRCHAMSPTASSVVTGRILSTSRNYAAQAVGDRDIVVHEQARLDRRVGADEDVTIRYEQGMGAVYDGILYDVQIEAEALSSDERAFLRASLLKTLALAGGRDDEVVKAALKFALKEAQSVFGWPKSPPVARLEVSDWVSMKLADLLAAQQARRDAPALAEGPRWQPESDEIPAIRIRN